MKYNILALLVILCLGCGESKKEVKSAMDDEPDQVRLMTLDPGHFHAALVQKTMYKGVDSTIYVFAPEGPEVNDFLNKIESYNSRSENPTHWKVDSYFGADYLEKMIAKKPGNVMVVAGKNSKKIDYILAAVKAGLNVYADKPLVINPEGFRKLEEAFKIAEEKGVMIYDIMTERFEVTTGMQRQFSMLPEVFGQVLEGSVEEPAIIKESVHHFFKYVSGQPLVRPAWFFDVNEEGEGIVDVTTHLVDLVQWELFPDEIINRTDIEMVQARRWPTVLTLEEFKRVTGLETYPDYLKKDLDGDKLKVYCNGEMLYKIKGKYAKVSVIWNYEAPEGTGDTHYSIMRGTKSDLIIKQGAEENYKPTLYVKSKVGENFDSIISEAIGLHINSRFAGTKAEKVSEDMWKINIPDEFKIGHEAHFAQVTQNYLRYLEEGKLPNWEVPNMITKYYTTIEGYKMAKK
ncbi:putative oxidoreductase C-terminal domain-containing protein [Arenibacter palladensis]|uniref:putative oxidoreductase C-terminal domain-containing protein n=1 Tax=Arenibacter palladensis TaxID=237373 RepID=UPI0026E24744|nr:putative oxidoreductase C-terminal domain-containing protein [Arenibacter palladensis]MDO6603776.1 putative oxidoreductase C-terminal domain-containing protein [Arenibacter palladensis]